MNEKWLFPNEASLEEQQRNKGWFITKPLLKKQMRQPFSSWVVMPFIKHNFIQDLTWHFNEFMKAMWLNLEDASLKDTPKRVAKMFINETCRGLYDEFPKITTFPNDENYTWMVVVKDIRIQSLCEHHFQPFIWKCHIAYIPGERVVWLSKFARVVDHFARRPQVQERLTKQIFDSLKKVLKTDNIAVIIDSEHFCMKLRGVMDPCSSTSTDMMWWLFLHSDPTRREFLDAINRKI